MHINKRPIITNLQPLKKRTFNLQEQEQEHSTAKRKNL
jgi:hypothetical protein